MITAVSPLTEHPPPTVTLGRCVGCTYLCVLQLGVDLLHVAVVVEQGGPQVLLHGGQPATQVAHAALQLLHRQHRLLQLALPATRQRVGF